MTTGRINQVTFLVKVNTMLAARGRTSSRSAHYADQNTQKCSEERLRRFFPRLSDKRNRDASEKPSGSSSQYTVSLDNLVLFLGGRAIEQHSGPKQGIALTNAAKLRRDAPTETSYRTTK